MKEPTKENLQEINAQLAELSKAIYPEGVRLMYVHVDDLREQELNARTMPKAMMSQLAENIESSGFVESVPLCATIKGEKAKQIWIVSGHHRVRGARAAGELYLLILLAENLTWDKVRSKQLSHNNIEGADDPEVVKQIFDLIDDVESRFRAFVDTKLFDAAPEPVRFTQVDVDFRDASRLVLLAFLPTQWEHMAAALEGVFPKADPDHVVVAHIEEWEQWSDALRSIRKDLDIISVPTAVAMMADLALERLEQLKEAEEDG